MSQLADQISKSRGLLGAVEAVTNRRAFITLFGTFTLSGLLMVAFSALTFSFLSNGQYGLSKVFGFLGFLIVAFVFVTGVSAAGFLLNDAMRNRTQRTISNSLLVALATLPRIMGVLALLLVLGLLLILAVVLILLLCKIPGLGPILYTIAFPVCAVTLGATFYAGLFVVVLHGPAIWEGNPVMRTVAILGAIARQRLMSVVIQTILLGLLVTLVSSIIFGAVFFGVSMTGALSIPILGQSVGVDMFAGLTSSIMGMGGQGGGYVAAASFGLVFLIGSAIVAPILVAMAGNCIIFANVTENLSTAEVEKSIQGAIDSAREKAEQARRHLEESRHQITASVPVTATTTPSHNNNCPKCSAPIANGDVFCGNCGNRLG